jgi:hypothetical protein
MNDRVRNVYLPYQYLDLPGLAIGLVSVADQWNHLKPRYRDYPGQVGRHTFLCGRFRIFIGYQAI